MYLFTNDYKKLQQKTFFSLLSDVFWPTQYIRGGASKFQNETH